MRFAFVCLLLAGLASFAQSAPAVPDQPRVHAVQSPVWVRRGAHLYPLQPGERLLAGDRIITGGRARAALDLPDGSVLKLGADVEFEIATSAQAEEEDKSLYRATLNVLKGAFRYTTRLLGRDRRRAIDIRVGTATIGIRGTDVWGKATERADMVYLLEGRVSLQLPGCEPMILDRPLHGMLALPDGDSRAAVLSREALAEFAAETEMRPDGAMMRQGGGWKLVVMSARERAHAEALAARLAAGGYPARIETAELAGRRWHRVVLPELAGRDHARRLGEALTGRFGIRGYWLLN